MEIFGIFVAVGFVAYLYERREKKALFPDQKCGYCPVWIYFDWGSRRWLHEYGVQYRDEPNHHPALPPYNFHAEYLS